MTIDILDTARAIVARARSEEEVEAFVLHQKNFEVKAYEGEVETLSSSEPIGAGVRVVWESRTGSSFTTDLSPEGIEAVVAEARGNARFSTPDEATGLAEPWDFEPADVPGLIDEGQGSVDPDRKVAFAIELERATAGSDARIRAVEEAGYSDTESEVAIATSGGIAGTFARTDAWCWTVAIAEEGDDTEVGFEFDLARGLAGLDVGSVAASAVDRATRVLGAKKIKSARMPIVFDPYTAGQFLGVIGSVLTGEAVQKGRSLFAGKLGEVVASAELTLVDDGRLDGAPGSGPWDAEGVPTRRTVIIEGGTLRSFLYDTRSARREGRSSTGNATRGGFKGTPGPSPSNLAFEPTSGSREQVLTDAGAALLVQDFHGVHSGANPITGDFSVGVTGQLLESGALGRPVKEVTIAAPMLDILKGIRAVGPDIRWLPFGGSYGGATTLVTEMTVAGI